MHLLQHYRAIVGQPADICLRLISSETVFSIAHRETFIGFRNTPPEQNGLAGRFLRHVHFAPFGRKDAPDQWIIVMGSTPSAQWLEKHIGHRAEYELSTPRNALDLALLGAGYALLPTFIGQAHADLEQKAEPIAELSHEQWLVTHDDDWHLPHIRRALDRIYRVFHR